MFFGAGVLAGRALKGLVLLVVLDFQLLLAVLDFQVVQASLDFQVLQAGLLDPLALLDLAGQEPLAVRFRPGWV